MKLMNKVLHLLIIKKRIELLLLEFEARYYEYLKARQGMGKYDKYNATLERKRR